MNEALLKEALCKAFCNDVQIRRVAAGLAIGTGFAGSHGDKVGFYVVNSELFRGKKRIQESGTALALLEGSGVDFKSTTRQEALEYLLAECGVTFARDDRRFYIDNLTEADVPSAALRFVAFMLRLQDFLLMTEYRVASTFREDAERQIRLMVGDKAVVSEDVAVAPQVADAPADFLIRAADRPPVAIFLGTGDSRVYEAIVLHMRLQHEVHIQCSVAVLVEKLGAISGRARQQAINRLSAFAEFRGDEEAAIERITRDAIGKAPIVH